VLHLPVSQFAKDREVLAENRLWRAPLPWSLGLQLALTPVVVLIAPRYLRSFHDHDTSVVLAKLVMPTAGRLAPVLATAHDLQPPEELYRRTNVLTTSRVTVLPDAAWREWLLSALPRCRAALIDVSMGSEGVLWELEQAKVILPPTRFMVLTQGKVPPPTLDLTDVTVVLYQLGWRGRFRARKALRSWLKRAC
jgi:hypothetical protein